MATIILMFFLVLLVNFAAKNARKLREDGYTIAPLVSLGGISAAIILWLLLSPLTIWADTPY
jgi:hypothetical protein